jgi:hypothetical protein
MMNGMTFWIAGHAFVRCCLIKPALLADHLVRNERLFCLIVVVERPGQV